MKQVLFTLALLGAALVLGLRAVDPASGAPPITPAMLQPGLPTGKVVISMLYSPAKQGWIEWARDQYVRHNPDVQVKLTPMASVLSVNQLLLGNEKPVVWSPESMLELGEAAERWQQQTAQPLYSGEPEYAPESLLRTPLVLLAWESRAKVLDDYLRKQAGDDPGVWKRLIEAAASREGWKGLGGPLEWGAVKFGYTDPLQTGVGLWTMYMACLDQAGGAVRLAAEQLADPAVIELLRVAAASPLTPLVADKDLVTRMEQFGPARYDIAVTYETLALEALKTPKERWERLVIYYPPRSPWSDHPAVVLQLDENSDQQKQAGLRWIHYLKSHAAQLEAIRYGFRPADASIPLSAGLGHNPFLGSPMQMGERLDGERAFPPPDGHVVTQLLQTLRSAFGRLE